MDANCSKVLGWIQLMKVNHIFRKGSSTVTNRLPQKEGARIEDPGFRALLLRVGRKWRPATQRIPRSSTCIKQDTIQIYRAAFTQTTNRSLALGFPSCSGTGTARRMRLTSLHPQRQLSHLTIAISTSSS
jgi:hypothetical protein